MRIDIFATVAAFDRGVGEQRELKVITIDINFVFRSKKTKKKPSQIANRWPVSKSSKASLSFLNELWHDRLTYFKQAYPLTP